jgi:hypothetical protein
VNAAQTIFFGWFHLWPNLIAFASVDRRFEYCGATMG